MPRIRVALFQRRLRLPIRRQRPFWRLRRVAARDEGDHQVQLTVLAFEARFLGGARGGRARLFATG